MTELQSRLLTAALMIGIVLAGLYFLPNIPFAYVATAIFGIGVAELGRLNKLKKSQTLMLLGIYALISIVTIHTGLYSNGDIIFIITGIFWLMMTLLIVAKVPVHFIQPNFRNAFVGMLIMYTAWLSINELRSDIGPFAVLAMMGLVWISDSAAYFSGKRFGRHKLAPVISPKKTIEGLVGALVVIFIYVLLINWLSDFHLPVILGLALVIIGVIGDLLESLLKRRADIKDSGTWLPGHGGLLDRVDSLAAVVPCYAAVLAFDKFFG